MRDGDDHAASKPRRAGKGWTVQLKTVGKVRFNGTVPDDETRNVRVVKHPPGTGYDVHLPDTDNNDSRDRPWRKGAVLAARRGAVRAG